MNELQLFHSDTFGDIRTARINGVIHFCGSDIAKGLGYKRANDAIRQHCKHTVKHPAQISGKVQNINFISEGDVFRLVTKSELPNAQDYERWIFDEVLPTINRTGGYVLNTNNFVATYFTGVSDDMKIILTNMLEASKQQAELIQQQAVAIDHKQTVIDSFSKKIPVAEKRQIITRIVRKHGKNYQEAYSMLYREYEQKEHINLTLRVNNYNKKNGTKITKMDYVEKELDGIPKLFELCVKLFEADVNELVKQLYEV